MKRGSICLFMVLMFLALSVVSAAAVSTEDITLEMLAEANSHEKLMEKHGSYHQHFEYPGEISGSTYADSELFYTCIPDSAIVYTNGQQCEIDDGVFAVHLYVGTEPDLEWTTGLIGYVPEEEIVEVVQEGERFIVKTLLASGDETEDGYCEFVYEVDMQDLCLLGGSYTDYAPDGTILYEMVWNVAYDVERPAQAQEMFDRMNPKEDYRTVTIVAEPGAENETVYSVNTARGDSACIYYSLDYKAFYTDPECTQVYEGGADTTQDLTLYVTKDEK